MKAVGRTKVSPVASRTRSVRPSGNFSVRWRDQCGMHSFILNLINRAASQNGWQICSQMLSSQILVLDFRNSRQRRGGHCYSRAKRQSQGALGTIYSRTKEKNKRKRVGETHCPLSKAIVSDSPLHQDLKSAFTKFCISAKGIQSHSRSANQAIEEIISNRKISSHSLTLSCFGFGLFRESNSAHAVMTSSRLHFGLDSLDKTAQDSIDMLHSLTQGHAHCIQLQSEAHALSPSTRTSVHRRPIEHLRAVCAVECTHAQ